MSIEKNNKATWAVFQTLVGLFHIGELYYPPTKRGINKPRNKDPVINQYQYFMVLLSLAASNVNRGSNEANLWWVVTVYWNCLQHYGMLCAAIACWWGLPGWRWGGSLHKSTGWSKLVGEDLGFKFDLFWYKVAIINLCLFLLVLYGR